VFARYRFPVVPVLTILAAGGLLTLIDRTEREGFSRAKMGRGVAHRPRHLG
jgi:hypothetical protein